MKEITPFSGFTPEASQFLLELGDGSCQGYTHELEMLSLRWQAYCQQAQNQYN